MATTDFNIPPEGIDLYVQRRAGDIEALREAFQLRDTPVFFRIGHGLKGNAINYGFPELEELGKKLEIVAKNEDWSLAQAIMTELESWYLRESKNKRCRV